LGDLAESQARTANALEQFEAARTIFEKLVLESPTDVNWRQSLSRVCNKIAKSRKFSGDLDGALSLYNEGLTIRIQLFSENGQSINFMTDVATSEFLVGEILRLRGATADALTHYRRSRELRKEILDRNPADEEARKEFDVTEIAIAAIATLPQAN
jgi:tetratricopeptide (TPR) repeat protein